MRKVLNPETISTPQGYSHVVEAKGRLIFVSGQVSLDKNGDVVGKGDIELQARQAYANLGFALAAVGANFDDVVRVTTYVVDYRPEHRAILRQIRSEHWPTDPPAATLLGVSALALPELLVEVEATAVIAD
jgi:enamine deaminase RidA (YjgF/YER057c/UK114 family)